MREKNDFFHWAFKEKNKMAPFDRMWVWDCWFRIPWKWDRKKYALSVPDCFFLSPMKCDSYSNEEFQNCLHSFFVTHRRWVLQLYSICFAIKFMNIKNIFFKIWNELIYRELMLFWNVKEMDSAHLQ